MKNYFKNLGLGLVLAIAALMTLYGVDQVLAGRINAEDGFVFGSVGIAFLFATISALLRRS